MTDKVEDSIISNQDITTIRDTLNLKSHYKPNTENSHKPDCSNFDALMLRRSLLE